MVPIVINLYGGPGCGKSTLAAELFVALKNRGVSCEVAWEWVKGPAWVGSIPCDQLYIMAKQARAILRPIEGGAQVVITDSPLLLSLVYGKGEGDAFRALVRQRYGSMANLDLLVARRKPYDPHGRGQTEAEARHLDVEIHDMLLSERVTFAHVRGVEDALPHILGDLRWQ